MSIIGIDWKLADKMYAREEEKIREDTQKKQQEAAKVWSQANRLNSGARVSEMHRIHIETLSVLADASINNDWDIVIRSGHNISESIIGNIITRLNNRLTRYVNNFMHSIEQSLLREPRGIPIFPSLREKSNEAKTKLLGKVKRELDIRRGLAMMEDLKEKRFQFLNKLNEIVGNDESQGKHAWQVGELLGFDNSLSWEIAQYLAGENLINIIAQAQRDCYIGITHQGIVELERALSEPNKPTEHFLPINIISVGQMVGSQIQQASPGAAQVITFNKDALEELKEIIQSLNSSIDELNLSDQKKSELQADVQTIEAQTSSSKPKGIIIKESLYSIRNILEGATGSAIASVLLPKVIALWGSLV